MGGGSVVSEGSMVGSVAGSADSVGTGLAGARMVGGGVVRTTCAQLIDVLGRSSNSPMYGLSGDQGMMISSLMDVI